MGCLSLRYCQLMNLSLIYSFLMTFSLTPQTLELEKK